MGAAQRATKWVARSGMTGVTLKLGWPRSVRTPLAMTFRPCNRKAPITRLAGSVMGAQSFNQEPTQSCTHVHAHANPVRTHRPTRGIIYHARGFLPSLIHELRRAAVAQRQIDTGDNFGAPIHRMGIARRENTNGKARARGHCGSGQR